MVQSLQVDRVRSSSKQVVPPPLGDYYCAPSFPPPDTSPTNSPGSALCKQNHEDNFHEKVNIEVFLSF